MIETITHFALNRSKAVYALLFILVAVSLALFPNISIDTDPENMLSSSDADRVFHNAVKRDFNMYDMLVIGVVNQSKSGIYNSSSLASLQSLSQHVAKIEHVLPHEVLSLNSVDNITQAEHGGISFKWLMREAPTTETQSLSIKSAVMRLPLLANTLVSNDGKAAAIYVAIDSKNYSYQVAEEVREYIKTLPTSDHYYITGLPVAEDQFGSEMFVTMTG